ELLEGAVLRADILTQLNHIKEMLPDRFPLEKEQGDDENRDDDDDARGVLLPHGFVVLCAGQSFGSDRRLWRPRTFLKRAGCLRWPCGVNRSTNGPCIATGVGASIARRKGRAGR